MPKAQEYAILWVDDLKEDSLGENNYFDFWYNIYLKHDKKEVFCMDINIIKQLCFEHKIKWSTHAAARIRERGIKRSDVLCCLSDGEVIEDYPEDFPFPSCLVFGHATNGSVIHVVVGYDMEYLYIVTAYIPDNTKFEEDLKTRKER